MKDYARIATKICESKWMITEKSLGVILGIVSERMNGVRLSDDEIALRLEDVARTPNESQVVTNHVNGVGIIPIEGPIFGKANLMTEMSGAVSLESVQKDFMAMMGDPNITSILLRIDSPGGVSDGVEEFATMIRDAREEKPIYAIADGMAGSAAYFIMSQAKKGYATPSGSVGSIGVYAVHKDQSVADAQAGNRFTFISAGPHKTELNPHEPISADAKAYVQEGVDDLYDTFVENVSLGRNVPTETVLSDFGGGRMLSSKNALEVGMIDGIMSYDTLLTSLTSQPQRVQVARSLGNGAYEFALATFDSRTGGYLIEHADLEHSEPGGGGPRQGNLDDSELWRGGALVDEPQVEPDQAGGWRREPLPLDPDDPRAPTPNSRANRGGEMNEEQLKKLRELMGLPSGASDDQIVATAEAVFTEHRQFSEAISVADQQKRFEKEYPAVYAEQQALLAESRENKARMFAESQKQCMKAVGDDFVQSDMGLSAMALDSIKATHEKFAQGNATLEDFENAINTITHGGIVEYGERGTATTTGTPSSTSTSGGRVEARKAFAVKVNEVRAENEGMSVQDATRLAAQKYPDLAAGYAHAVPIVAGNES